MTNNESSPITVSQLTASIKYHLEDKFYSLWVAGEITGISRPASGHIYFTLKDSRTQIRSVIWRSTAERLNLEFLEDGLEVACFGNIDVYGARGLYQLNLRKIQPLGEGALQLAFKKLHAKLASEGLFEPEHKQPIPPIPKRIAVVTSPTGAAIRDFLQVIDRRWPNLEIIIVPVQVQGPGAAGQISDAIYAIPDFEHPPDVVVVTRGGGSAEDLWCFNDERVCRAIFNCPIPVISGVGHEIDVTLADLVADLRALTPSEAAERLVPNQKEVMDWMASIERRMKLALNRRLSDARQTLELLAARPVLAQPLERVRVLERELEGYESRIGQAIKTNLLEKSHELSNLATKLEAISPLSILARGYSLTTDSADNLIDDCKQVQSGDKIKTRLKSGTIISQVEQVD